MLGLFRKPSPKEEEKKSSQSVSTVTGALVQRSGGGDTLSGEVLKGIVESAAMNQPQLAEHITSQIITYITEVVDEPFQSLFATMLAPAVLLGDASNKELADMMAELYANRLRFTTGPRAISHTLAIDYDLHFAAAQPILRLAKKSHLLHVALRYGPIVMDED